MRTIERQPNETSEQFEARTAAAAKQWATDDGIETARKEYTASVDEAVRLAGKWDRLLPTMGAGYDRDYLTAFVAEVKRLAVKGV